MTPAALLARLEAISRERPDRVLRLQGTVPAGPDSSALEPFELLIYRGFSSSTTHPTALDPDQPVTPEGFALTSAELLAGPLNPAAELVLEVAISLDHFLDPGVW